MFDESPAIRQSRARLVKAREALARLESSKSFASSESNWSDFLIAGNAVYSKLEQGSKLNGRAAAWFGRMKKIQREDWLLSYMHHARNAEEHGIDDVTQRMSKGQATLTVREEPGKPFDATKLEGLELFIGTDQRGHVVVKSSDETLIASTMYDADAIALVQVKDTRFNDSFNPPYKHLDRELEDVTPLGVGRLFVHYLAGLIEDGITAIISFANHGNLRYVDGTGDCSRVRSQQALFP